MRKKIEKEKRRSKRTVWSPWRPRAIVFDKKVAAKRCNM